MEGQRAENLWHDYMRAFHSEKYKSILDSCGYPSTTFRNIGFNIPPSPVQDIAPQISKQTLKDTDVLFALLLLPLLNQEGLNMDSKENKEKEMQNTTPDLKPCPFCGGKAEVRMKGYAYSKNRIQNEWVVKCMKGCCETPPFSSDISQDVDTGAVVVKSTGIKEAVDAWNKREG